MTAASPATENAAVPLLDTVRLAAVLGPAACRFDVDARVECDSTNSVLLARVNAPSGSVVVADRQSAGRGRRGRGWVSEPAASLTFSLLWRFARPAAAMAGLSLAVGVALARALASLGHADVALKWPNDLLRPLAGGWGKLGGILVEMVAERGGTAVVIGIGLNLQAPAVPAGTVLPAVGLGTAAPDRHEVLAAILGELVVVLDTFGRDGFAPFVGEWQQRHAFAGGRVRLEEDGRIEAEGRCLGVDADGALLLESGGETRRWLSGDVSLRPA